MNWSRYIFYVVLIFFSSCQKSNTLFEELEYTYTGVEFKNDVEDSDQLSILDYMYFYNGAGVAAGDVNNDGLIDLFFVSNQSSNKLYINQGNLQFEEVSQIAKTQGKSSWNTGVTLVDINNDGWLDIYVCAVVGIHGFMGHNELYINQRDGTFKEAAADYGLDIQNYATSAVFFDYDRDGDLDMYLLNHGIHNTNNYLGVEERSDFNKMTSDKLYNNEDGKFTDVTKEAKLFGGKVGYGLAVSVSDLNGDHWDDLYVSNDFYENDYLYINQKNGTFKESIEKRMSQTSQFSMGNDISDINHDGFVDIITLDMLPKDEKILKSSISGMNYNSLIQRRRYGYMDQFPRNHLQINMGGKKFLEIGMFAGIAATDWSWAPVFADFDNDGFKDLVISNGIYRRPNDADYIKYVSSDQILTKISKTRLIDKLALEKMPKGDVKNFYFKGEKGLLFTDQSNDWVRQKPSFSNGMVAADLDNDGDLDLVYNNLNSLASIFENKLKNSKSIKIQFKGPEKNRFGVGAKIFLYASDTLFYEQLHTTRGFLSSFPPEINIGIGAKVVDSIKVIWPDEKIEFIDDVQDKSRFTFDYRNSKSDFLKKEHPKNQVFEAQEIPDIQHSISENYFPEFNREKLMPYGVTEEGTPIATADVNGDKIDDLYIGGPKGQASVLFLSSDFGYFKSSTAVFENDLQYEDVDAIFSDIDGDNDLDLFVISGGGEYDGKSNFNKDRIYINDGAGSFNLANNILPEYHHTGSVIAAADIDGDGDDDYFIGSRVITKSFGIDPTSYLLINHNGRLHFDPDHPTSNVGMVKDAVFADLDDDFDQDLIIASEWSSLKIFENINGTLIEKKDDYFQNNPSGLWQSLSMFDVDEDGNDEIVIGNIGLNTKFSTSSKYPLKMYVNDFDGNEQIETIVSMAKNGKYYPIDPMDKLSGQIETLIKKKYNNFKAFAGQTTEQVFGKTLLAQSDLKLVEELRSGYFKLNEGRYTFVPFPNKFQWGPISLLKKIQLANKDHLILTGAKLNLPPYQGLWNSQQHFLLESLETSTVLNDIGLDLFHQKVIGIEIMNVNGSPLLAVVFHNGPVTFFKITASPNDIIEN